MTAEQWKPIVGLEGAYEVSNLGRVRRIPQVVQRLSRSGKVHQFHVRGGLLKPHVIGGSVSYHFHVNGKSSGLTLGRLLADAFGPYTPGARAKTWDERLQGRISPEPNSGCWLWMGAMSADSGYGSAWIKGPARGIRGRLDAAHRAVYRAIKGEIPAGLELDHKCRNRICVNPDHMEPVTTKVNVQRGAKVNRDLCPYKKGTIC